MPSVYHLQNGKARPNIKAMKALKQYCEENGLAYEPLERSWREILIHEEIVWLFEKISYGNIGPTEHDISSKGNRYSFCPYFGREL